MSNNPFAANTGSSTNNPFALAADPNDPSNRFPKLDGNGDPLPSSSQFPQQPLGMQPTGYYPNQPYQQQQQQRPGAYQQQQPSYLGQPQQLSAQPTGFQPSSSFGQQLHAHYGPGPIQTNATGASYQTSNPSYSAVADFDPYASLASLPWAQPASSFQPQSNSTSSSNPPKSPTSQTSFHRDHPRSYVQAHKTELDKWDGYSWKQLLNSFDALKDAWTERKQIVIKATEEYRQQWTHEEIARCQNLLTEAEQNIDTIAAAAFQIREVEQGYRHSSDSASRSRVREALNAGLKALPEWPEQLQTGSGERVGYNAPSGTQMSTQGPTFGNGMSHQYGGSTPGGMMPQQTGYGGGMMGNGYGNQLNAQPTGYGGGGMGMGIMPQQTGYGIPQQPTGWGGQPQGQYGYGR